MKDKTVIDWSKAPDNCIGAVERKHDSPYKDEPDNVFGFFVEYLDNKHLGEYVYCSNDSISPMMKYHDFIPKPESIPVYTQAMKDDGILPSIGMECEWKHHSTNVVLTFIGDEMFCGKNDSGKETAGYISDLKPINPPIELIDGNAYQFDHYTIGTAVGFYSQDKGLFDCAGVSFSIESGCTNIQLLEVKS